MVGLLQMIGGSPLFIKPYNYGHTLSGVRVQRVQRIHRVQRVVVMGGCAASINKTFTTALAGGENALPPLVAGATTFPSAEACHWILSRPRAPYESSSLATPASLVGLWVLSSVPHGTTGKGREVYSAPCIGVASERDLQGSDSDPKIT